MSTPLLRLLRTTPAKAKATAKAKSKPNPAQKPTYNLHIACHVKPNTSSKREGIISVGPDRVDVCVAAVPKNGEANSAVEGLFAGVLQVSKSRVEVIRGLKSREKTLCVEGVDVDGSPDGEGDGEEKFLSDIQRVLSEAVK